MLFNLGAPPCILVVSCEFCSITSGTLLVIALGL